jgi:hypothetical protein
MAMEAQHPQASTMALKPTDSAAQRSALLGLGKDFLAIFDVRPGPSFGKLVTMLPVGMAMMAHHTNYAEPPNDYLRPLCRRFFSCACRVLIKPAWRSA